MPHLPTKSTLVRLLVFSLLLLAANATLTTITTLDNPTGVLTFDDIDRGVRDIRGNLAILNTPDQKIIISSENVSITNYSVGANGNWNGSKPWFNSAEKPGLFLATTYSNATIYFSPPVARVLIRYGTTEPGSEITVVGSAWITNTTLPYSGDNTYSSWGVYDTNIYNSVYYIVLQPGCRVDSIAWLALNYAPNPVPIVNIESPDVVPIMDCSSTVNSTHFRSYWSYRSKNSNTVSVPIGNSNYFAPGSQNQGQPTVFSTGRSNPYLISIDTLRSQTIEWTLTQYNLEITESTNSCSNDVSLSINISASSAPSAEFVQATSQYFQDRFNVSSDAVNITIIQDNNNSTYQVIVVVSVSPTQLEAAIKNAQDISNDPSTLQQQIKQVVPDIAVNEVRGQPPSTAIEGVVLPVISTPSEVISAAIRYYLNIVTLAIVFLHL